MNEILRAKVRALCEEYEDTHGILVVIEEDGTDNISILGNLCPVCGLLKLTEAILENNINHNSEKGKIH